VLPEPVLDLIRSQRGVIARHQVRALEPDRRRRRRVYEDPHLEASTARVLRHRAVPPCREQAVMTSVLDAGPGGVLWAKSGATLWGFGRERLLPAHVAIERRHEKYSPRCQLHVVKDLRASECVTHLDVPVARPERIVLWIAGALTHRFGHEIALARTAALLDQAWRQRLIDGPYLHELAARSGGRGRSGIVVLRQALEERPPDYKPAGSRLEERFEEVVSPSVRGQLRRQVTVDVEPVIRTVDFRLDRWPLIVEVNGEAWHTSLTDRAADAERYERLLTLGFSVVVFWEYDIWHDQATVRRAMDHLLERPDATPTLHRPTPAPWDC
jgi:very-short-patch-repair endonuclease